MLSADKHFKHPLRVRETESAEEFDDEENRCLFMKRSEKMKNLIISAYLVFAVFVFLVSCGGGSSEPGSIYGIVTDKATGEPIQNAGVELQPLGLKTVTGSDGQYEFNEVVAGSCTLYVTKTGYVNQRRSMVVESGKQSKGDVQLEKLPAALRIVDDNGKDISELDFGEKLSDVSRQFNIFNDGTGTWEWELFFSADWIKSVSKESGELKEGGTQGVIVNIDRSLLESGENVTTIHVTSNDGNKQLTIKAVDGTVLPTLNTLEATDVRTTSAVLNAEILTKGVPSYSERGFVYAHTSMPTLEDTLGELTAKVTEENLYSATVTGLEMGETYYVRGYAINEAGVAYSTNQVKVVPQTVLASVMTKLVSNVNPDSESASATFNGTIVDEGDPAYTERGFVYGTVHNSTVEDDTKKVATGSGTGDFSVNVSELEFGTVYYIRAYAINDKGVAYGNEITLNFEDYLPYVTVPGTNLIAAKEDAGVGSWKTAMSMCEHCVVAGFSDWRLPTYSELEILYTNKNYIGGFKPGWYWSSTTVGNSSELAWYLDFSNGLGYSNYKSNSLYVRCVRTAE